MIRYIVYIAVLLCTGCHARDKSNDPLRKTHEFILGDKTIRVTQTIHKPEGRLAFIQLHDDEKTAVSSALQTISEHGGTFITIENNGERNIRFKLKNERFTIDPNRIFTSEGRKQTLEIFGNYSERADRIVKEFSEFLLALVPEKAVIIAIHNNTNSKYSIGDYNKSRKHDASKVHINPSMDSDDFIFTTESRVYELAASENINVILQDNENVKDDGSLSVYFGKRGRPYINIEAEHGHVEQQEAMINFIIKIINEL